MLSGKLNLYHDSEKNMKLKQIAWITNTVEDDLKKLEEMFWPTPEEILRNIRLNDAARKWLKEYREAKT